MGSTCSPAENVRIVENKSWLEIGRPWDILAANEILLEDLQAQMLGEIEPGAT